MPVGAFVPSRIHLDYPEWQTPLIGNVGQAWAYDGTGYVPTSFLLSSAVSAYGLTLIDDADAAAARGTLGLGTAAIYNVGTGANQIVQLDGSSRLPAVDGSQLTGISGSPGGSTTQVQYNNAGAFAGDAGLTYNASTDRLTVAGGLIAGDWSPPSDSTTAVSIWNAARSTRVVTVDTTNKQLIVTSSSANAQAAPYIGTFNDSTRTRYFISYDTNFSIARAISPDGARYLQTQVANGYAQFATNADLEFIAGGSGNFMQFRPNISGYTMLLTDGRMYLRGGSANVLKFSIQGVSGQTNNLQEWQTNAGVVLASMSSSGAIAAGHANAATAFADIAASTTTRASLRVRAGTAPTTPNAGDIWHATGDRLKLYRAATETIASGVPGTGGSATAGGTWGATEQAMLQAVYDIARSFGMLS